MGTKGGPNALIVASLNINGFSDVKQEWVANYILNNKVDVMVIVDTRLTDNQTGWAKRRISQIVGRGVSFVTTFRGSNLKDGIPGGIIIISMPRMGNVVSKRDDPLRVGSRLVAAFVVGPLPFVVMGVYFPFNNKKAGIKTPDLVSKSLEHRMSRALEEKGGDEAHSKPADFLWNYISRLSARTRDAPRSSFVVAGDFNGTFGNSKSSYHDLHERSIAVSLVKAPGGPPAQPLWRTRSPKPASTMSCWRRVLPSCCAGWKLTTTQL